MLLTLRHKFHIQLRCDEMKVILMKHIYIDYFLTTLFHLPRKQCHRANWVHHFALHVLPWNGSNCMHPGLVHKHYWQTWASIPDRTVHKAGKKNCSTCTWLDDQLVSMIFCAKIPQKFVSSYFSNNHSASNAITVFLSKPEAQSISGATQWDHNLLFTCAKNAHCHMQRSVFPISTPLAQWGFNPISFLQPWAALSKLIN